MLMLTRRRFAPVRFPSLSRFQQRRSLHVPNIPTLFLVLLLPKFTASPPTPTPDTTPEPRDLAIEFPDIRVPDDVDPGSFASIEQVVPQKYAEFAKIMQEINAPLVTALNMIAQRLDADHKARGEKNKARREAIARLHEDNRARVEQSKAMREDIGKLRKEVASLPEIITGSRAINVAMRTTTRVEISPAGEGNDKWASGSYVTIDGICYVSTSRHAVSYEVGNKSAVSPRIRRLRTIKKLEMVDGVELRQLGEAFWSEPYDLGLIPVGCEASRTPLQIADVEPRLGLPLHGLSHRPNGLAYLHGSVLEKNHTYGTFETDCQGTYGFSGTGYLDITGVLVAVHAGAGLLGHMGSAEPEVPFNLDEELADSKLEFDWDEAGRACVRAWTLNATQAEIVQCLGKLGEVVDVEARNPRTSVEAAVHLIDLAKNKTRQAA